METRYIKKLIQLADEVEKLNRPEVIRAADKTEAQYILEKSGFEFQSKLNHLLGYIQALKDFIEFDN